MKAVFAILALSPLAPAALAFSISPTSLDTPLSGRHRQTLFFNDARTGVPVHIIGSMHYNPYSVSKVERILQFYAENGRLGSVALESCEERWNRRLQPSGTALRSLLDNEFQAAAEVASNYNESQEKEEERIRLVLADEDINANNERIKTSFATTISDLADPLHGWESIASDIRRGYIENFSPPLKLNSAQDQYLGTDDFFDSDLLGSAPISLIRYIVGFVVKKPLLGSLVLAWLAALVGYGAIHGVGDLSAAEEIQVILAAISLNVILGVPLLGRVMLITLLSDRNLILASNIRNECERLQSEGRGDKVCVVVLGLAHCNGVKRLLCE